MKNNILTSISNQMIERYSKRYNNLGYDVKTLGWGTLEQQQYRFHQTLDGLNFTSSTSILDIGCGFGDYFTFLRENNLPFSTYIGWDINADLISEARSRWSISVPQPRFEQRDLLTLEISEPVADQGIMLGILNLNLRGKMDNYEYSFLSILKAFSAVKKTLAVDFLSTKLTPEYAAEDFVFYHDPEKVLNFALSLTSKVVLKHNYAPNPQREFMLFLNK